MTIRKEPELQKEEKEEQVVIKKQPKEHEQTPGEPVFDIDSLKKFTALVRKQLFFSHSN
jgi:hypothetical protein